MKGIASPSEIKARLCSRSHWLRYGASILLGHVYGAFGFGAALSLSLLAYSIGRGLYRFEFLPLLDAAQALGHLLGLVFASAILMLIGVPASTIVVTPILLICATVLATGKRTTTILGALVGFLLGWLFNFATGPEKAPYLIAIPAAGMGAGYAFALWQVCLDDRRALARRKR